MIRLIVLALVVGMSWGANPQTLGQQINEQKPQVSPPPPIKRIRRDGDQNVINRRRYYELNHPKVRTTLSLEMDFKDEDPQKDVYNSYDSPLNDATDDEMRHLENVNPKLLWQLWKAVEMFGKKIAIEVDDPAHAAPHQVAVIDTIIHLAVDLAHTCSADEYVKKYDEIVSESLKDSFERPKKVAERLLDLMDLLDSQTERIDDYINNEFDDTNQDSNAQEPGFWGGEESQTSEEVLFPDYDNDLGGDHGSHNPWNSLPPPPWTLEVIVKPKQNKDKYYGNYDKSLKRQNRNDRRARKSSQLDQDPDFPPPLSATERMLESSLTDLARAILTFKDLIEAAKSKEKLINLLVKPKAYKRFFPLVLYTAEVLQLVSKRTQCDLTDLELPDDFYRASKVSPFLRYRCKEYYPYSTTINPFFYDRRA